MPSRASIRCRALVPTACSRAPPRPEHDRLLAWPLKVHERVHVGQIAPARPRAHLLDHDRDRMRQLVPHAFQRRLPDELGHHHLLRLVGQLAVRVQRPARGQLADEHFLEHVQAEPGHGRYRHHVGPFTQLGHRDQLLHDLFLTGLVGHRDDGDHRLVAQARQLAGQVGVAGSDRLRRGHAESDHVDLGEYRPGQAVQPLTEQGAGLVQPGRVHDDQLRVGTVHDPPDHPPGRLRTAAGDGHLGADQRVHQGRLAGIRAADETGEPRSEPGFGGGMRCGHLRDCAVLRQPGDSYQTSPSRQSQVSSPDSSSGAVSGSTKIAPSSSSVRTMPSGVRAEQRPRHGCQPRAE